MDAQEINLKAAKICQPKIVHPNGETWLNDYGNYVELLITLTEEYGLSICGQKGALFVWDEKNQKHLDGLYLSFMEAVNAAIEVIDE